MQRHQRRQPAQRAASQAGNRQHPTRFSPRPNRQYIAFYKPYAVLSQFTQPEGSTKATLAAFGFPKAAYPVGRLDYDSEGLLLLSDDPALNIFLLDPEHGHQRTYLVQVEGIPTEQTLRMLCSGVMIEGRQTRPAIAELLTSEPPLDPRPVPIRERKSIPTSWIRLTLTEGRNRQVRRMTAAVGHPTLRLVRVSIGMLHLSALGLAPGQWRTLEPKELMLALQQSPGARRRPPNL